MIKVGDYIPTPLTLQSMVDVKTLKVIKVKRAKLVVELPVLGGMTMEIDKPVSKTRKLNRVDPDNPEYAEAHLAETVKYVEEAFKWAAENEAFELCHDPDYELYVEPNWIWVKGNIPPELQATYEHKLMFNCFAIELPVMFVRQELIDAHAAYSERVGAPSCTSWDVYSGRNKSRSPLKKGAILYGYRSDYPGTLELCLEDLRDEDDAEIRQDELTKELLEGRLEPISLQLESVAKLRQKLFAVPLLPREANVVIKEWGFFKDWR